MAGRGMITAINAHEAAHGVVAALVGYDVEEVKCSQRSGFVQAGRFRGAPAGASILVKMRMRMRADCCFALAGPVGENEYTRERIGAILSRCTADRRIARKAAVGYALTLPDWHPDAHLQAFDDFLRQARRMVRSNWPTIRVLAEKLALNGRLDGRDVLRAIEVAARQAAA
jgi:hypothetical protein